MGTLRLVNRASRLLRRRKIYKKFGDTSGSSRGDFHKERYRRGCRRRRRRRIYNMCNHTRRRRRMRRVNWPKDDASELLLLWIFLYNIRIGFI